MFLINKRAQATSASSLSIRSASDQAESIVNNKGDFQLRTHTNIYQIPTLVNDCYVP